MLYTGGARDKKQGKRANEEGGSQGSNFDNKMESIFKHSNYNRGSVRPEQPSMPTRTSLLISPIEPTAQQLKFLKDCLFSNHPYCVLHYWDYKILKINLTLVMIRKNMGWIETKGFKRCHNFCVLFKN